MAPLPDSIGDNDRDGGIVRDWPYAIESRSACGWAIATGPGVCMQPDRASAVMMAVIGIRNTRATRTGAIPHSETALVLHRLWLTNGFCAAERGICLKGDASPPRNGERLNVDQVVRR